MKNAPLAVGVIAVVALLALVAWLHDFVTMSGARTVYGVECKEGVWKGTTCTGRMRAGERYRFKTLKGHGEVLFWTAGSQAPSGKMSGCQIVNAREWTCTRVPDQPKPITSAMKNGWPVAAGGKPPSKHSVEKWKWLLLEEGATFFHDADT